MRVPRPQLRVLVVDDNKSSASALARLLSKSGHSVEAVFCGQSAIERIEDDPPDVVLTDLRMEPVNGLRVLQVARAMDPPVAVIVFTAHGDVDVAVKAMRMGAADFLTKPVTLEQVYARLERLHPVDGGSRSSAPEAFVAVAASSRRMMELLNRAADVPSPVWIEGDLGTGRTYCARILHDQGRNSRTQPFHVRDPSSDGPWPEAGTIVLPQVDQLSVSQQRRLVRQLHHVPSATRLIVSALPEGRRRVREGEILPELFYRLAVVVISVPKLVERSEDIEPMFTQALRSFAIRYKRAVPDLTDAIRADLASHAWPGNVRELLNLAERTVVLGESGWDLSVRTRGGTDLPVLAPGFSLLDHMEQVEKRILQSALQRAAGDRAEVGRLLGLERNTLRYKLKKYDLLDR